MKKITSLLLALLLALPILSAAVFAEKDPIYDLALDSQGVYVFNPQTGTALYEKSAESRMFPASTTKIMTALVVLENCADPRTETITVGDPSLFSYIVEDGGVHMELSRGETFTVYDLLTGLLMSSFCDAADLLAYHFGGGDVSVFIEKMNKKAEELGLENTHFENAHGLHSPDHYSSPKDIALFFEEALKHEIFREIISTRSYTLPATNVHAARPIRYTVSIYYDTSDYHLSAFVGGKSGFTDQAGRCLATFSEKDGVSYISVLLGANMDSSKNYTDNMSWVETHTLISYLYDHFQMRSVLTKGQKIAEIAVTDSETKLPVLAGEDILVLTRNDSEPSYEIQLPKEIAAPEVADGKKIGSVALYFNGEKAEGSYPLVLSWDKKPIPTKGAIEKGAESAANAVLGIFREDKVFVILFVLLLLTVGICLPAVRVTQRLQKSKSHRPKH